MLKSRRIRMSKHVARAVKVNVCSVLVGEDTGKRMVGKHCYK
jgi:hypothetical protein